MVDPAGPPGRFKQQPGRPQPNLFTGGDMTAEAPSAVSTGKSPESVVDEGTTHGPLIASPDAAAGPGSDGATTPSGDGSFTYSPNGNGPHSHGVSPNGAGPAEDPPDLVEDRTGSAEPESADPGTADETAERDVVAVETAEPETAEAGNTDAGTVEAGTVEPGTANAQLADRQSADRQSADVLSVDAGSVDAWSADDWSADGQSADVQSADVQPADAQTTDAGSADTWIADGQRAGGRTAEGDGDAEVPDAVTDGSWADPDGSEPATAGSLSFGSDASDPAAETAVVDAVLAEPEVVEDGPPRDEAVVVEVAEQLGSVVGADVEPDPAEFAAAAVLDVLRAAGWADAAEAAELRAEATRLRELLAEVIRDHRAREASAAGGQNQQLYWLVPLLRAAHGVAFGSLGAKVALRTAVQEVPPDVLATAGLRIDYGVEPAYDD